MGLFGRSSDRRPAASDRCMECGMTDGQHTDWCPTVVDEQEATPSPGAASTPEDRAGEATPPQ